MLAVSSKSSSCWKPNSWSRMLSNIFIDTTFYFVFLLFSFSVCWFYWLLGFFLLKFCHTLYYFYLSMVILLVMLSILVLSFYKFYEGELFILHTDFGDIYFIVIFFFNIPRIFYYFSFSFYIYSLTILCFIFFLTSSELLPLPSDPKLYFYR